MGEKSPENLEKGNKGEQAKNSGADLRQKLGRTAVEGAKNKK